MSVPNLGGGDYKYSYISEAPSNAVPNLGNSSISEDEPKGSDRFERARKPKEFWKWTKTIPWRNGESEQDKWNRYEGLLAKAEAEAEPEVIKATGKDYHQHAIQQQHEDTIDGMTEEELIQMIKEVTDLTDANLEQFERDDMGAEDVLSREENKLFKYILEGLELEKKKVKLNKRDALYELDEKFAIKKSKARPLDEYVPSPEELEYIKQEKSKKPFYDSENKRRLGLLEKWEKEYGIKRSQILKGWYGNNWGPNSTGSTIRLPGDYGDDYASYFDNFGGEISSVPDSRYFDKKTIEQNIQDRIYENYVKKVNRLSTPENVQKSIDKSIRVTNKKAILEDELDKLDEYDKLVAKRTILENSGVEFPLKMPSRKEWEKQGLAKRSKEALKKLLKDKEEKEKEKEMLKPYEDFMEHEKVKNRKGKVLRDLKVLVKDKNLKKEEREKLLERIRIENIKIKRMKEAEIKVKNAMESIHNLRKSQGREPLTGNRIEELTKEIDDIDGEINHEESEFKKTYKSGFDKFKKAYKAYRPYNKHTNRDAYVLYKKLQHKSKLEYTKKKMEKEIKRDKLKKDLLDAVNNKSGTYGRNGEPKEFDPLHINDTDVFNKFVRQVFNHSIYHFTIDNSLRNSNIKIPKDYNFTLGYDTDMFKSSRSKTTHLRINKRLRNIDRDVYIKAFINRGSGKIEDMIISNGPIQHNIKVEWIDYTRNEIKQMRDEKSKGIPLSGKQNKDYVRESMGEMDDENSTRTEHEKERGELIRFKDWAESPNEFTLYTDRDQKRKFMWDGINI